MTPVQDTSEPTYGVTNNNKVMKYEYANYNYITITYHFLTYRQLHVVGLNAYQ
jgi:hypothetical protein